MEQSIIGQSLKLAVRSSSVEISEEIVLKRNVMHEMGQAEPSESHTMAVSRCTLVGLKAATENISSSVDDIASTELRGS